MGPEGLLAQMIIVGTPELYDHLTYTGGAYRKAMIDGWLEGIGSLEARNVLIDHPTRDSFWNTTSLSLPPGPLYEYVRAKAIHLGGWFDIMGQGTIEGFMGYNYQGTEWARGNQTLIMGPWPHGIYRNQVGEIDFPKNAANSSAENIWLDLLAAELLGDETARQRYTSIPRVNYYMMGPDDGSPGVYNEWRYANDWPLPGVSNQSWYLQADGTLESSGIAKTGNISYIFDPANPVPTRGGANLIMPAGPYDQADLEQRADYITFTSTPLTKAVEIAGYVYAKLFIATNCTDTDFSVKLLDAYPDGRSMLISEGYLRARYWNGFDQVNLLTPLKVYEITVDLWSTAYHFAVGHSIRLSVTSSNFPRSDLNPNNGTAVHPDFNPAIHPYNFANNTIVMSSLNASRLILPIV